MTEFSEVMRQWRRMCDAMETNAGECYGCDICPVNNATDTMGCGAIFDMPPETNWEGMAEKIMRWAADHQEPVYPTWWDWLHEMGVLTGGGSGTIHEPIPADIAEMLGIKPKEG